MASNETGILAWTTSIRTSMAEDPARQFFEDQIQSLGFLFLDDYLDNILAGAKQDAIIDLVKTPGRKKDAPKRTRAATAAATKMKSVISLSLEDDDLGKENVPPVNSFHKALLQAKSKTEENAAATPPFPQSSGKVTVESVIDPKSRKQKVVNIAEAPSVNAQMLGDKEVAGTEPPTEEQSLRPLPVLALPLPETNELSVIAEDDDESADRSRNSVQLPQLKAKTPPPEIPPVEEMSPASQQQGDVIMQDQEPHAFAQEQGLHVRVTDMDTLQDIPESGNVTISTSSSANTFHSIPFNSPEPASPTSPPPAVSKPVIVPETQNHNLTEPLPDRPSPQPEDTNATAPLPSSSSTLPASNIAARSTTMLIPLRDHDSRSQDLMHKKSVPQFSALPAPSPLRKSVRVPIPPREPSLGLGLTSAAPVGVGGKRTSWLQKVREAKAMEGNAVAAGKRMSALGAGVGGGPMPAIFPGGAAKRKSGEMLGSGSSSSQNLAAFILHGEAAERQSKIAKVNEGDVGVSKDRSKDKDKEVEPAQARPQPFSQPERLPSPPRPVQPAPQREDLTVPLRVDPQEGMIDRFKRTVEGLGARVGKSMGKSLGGGTAAETALAEARAAAEARVAERNKVEGRTGGMPAGADRAAVPMTVESTTAVEGEKNAPPSSTSRPRELEKRLSVSDLITAYDKEGQPQQGKVLRVSSHFRPSGNNSTPTGDESTSTTPPNSPPAKRPSSFVIPGGPVFNKPPVFVPPLRPAPPPAATKTDPAREFSFNLPASTFALPASVPLGVRLPSPREQLRKHGAALSAQSTLASVRSDTVFDRRDDEEDVPAWMPATQDTEYTSSSGSGFDTQTQVQRNQNQMLDEDDSWPLEKVTDPNQAWTPFGIGNGKEDSMTWSTLPTESQGADSAPAPAQSVPLKEQQSDKEGLKTGGASGAFDMEVDADADADVEEDEDDRAISIDSDLEDMVEAGKSTVSLVGTDGPSTRSQSQMSIASSSSQQSHVGLFGQATKFVSSVLGASKKGKPEVKSLQLAAAAAKKQQEEKDKKAARLKEMENRRQLALQRKADEEKTRVLEEEKKIKEEGERRKREREEHTDKRPLKGATKKADEDNTKKRKLVVEIEKKPEAKKLPPKDKETAPTSRLAKPSLNAPSTTAKLGKPAPAQKQPAAALVSSTTYNASAAMLSTVKILPSTADTKPIKSTTATSSATKNKGKAKAPVQPLEDDIAQPSNIVQTQMAARVKAQIQAANQQEPIIPSESIELPDINSEYSDSEDEDRPRTFDPPNWAQSPELRQALQMQSTLNPDDIFGTIRPLRMEEIFRERQSRFRARTSSANWTGTDRLTIEEEREYARRMGFR